MKLIRDVESLSNIPEKFDSNFRIKLYNMNASKKNFILLNDKLVIRAYITSSGRKEGVIVHLEFRQYKLLSILYRIMRIMCNNNIQ